MVRTSPAHARRDTSARTRARTTMQINTVSSAMRAARQAARTAAQIPTPGMASRITGLCLNAGSGRGGRLIMRGQRSQQPSCPERVLCTQYTVVYVANQGHASGPRPDTALLSAYVHGICTLGQALSFMSWRWTPTRPGRASSHGTDAATSGEDCSLQLCVPGHAETRPSDQGDATGKVIRWCVRDSDYAPRGDVYTQCNGTQCGIDSTTRQNTLNQQFRGRSKVAVALFDGSLGGR